MFKLIVPAILFAVAASAQPVIFQNGVVNSASYVPAGLPGFGVAQGSIATMFGSGFPSQYAKVSAWPLQKTLANVSIKITVGSTTVDAYPLELANAGQISFLVPSNTPVGTGKITVTTPAGTSAAVDVVILAANPGLYANNMGGFGGGRFQDPLGVSNADQGFYAVGKSARPGQDVDIWLTGLGAVSWDETNPPSGNTATSATVDVWVGGRKADIIYKGRSGCCAGLDQIRFRVPQGVTGCFVPVYVQVGQAVSNILSLPIAQNGGACSDPTGLSEAQVNSITQGRTIRIGSLTLSRQSAMGFNIESASGSFFQYGATNLANTNVGIGILPFGSCTVYRTEGSASVPEDLSRPLGLNAGPALTLSGGASGNKTLTSRSVGSYSATLSSPLEPPYLREGQYTITGPGGSDVGNFTAVITVPSALNWTNASQLTRVQRSQGATVTWTGGGVNDYVMITGFSSVTTPKEWTVAFNCYERAAVGTFTVPAGVLLQLPPTPSGGESAGFMGVSTYTSPVSFSASGLDSASIQAISATAQMVTWQ